MRYKKTVWVMDIYNYLTYLHQCLDQLVPKFPWLENYIAPVQHWDWLDTSYPHPDQSRTPRDLAVDWVVRQDIDRMFYLLANNHTRNSEYENVYHELITHFDIQSYAFREIFMPHLYHYGEVHPGRIWRHHCWLYVECEVTTQTLEQYALHPNATA